MGYQLVGVAAIIGFVSVIAFPTFMILKNVNGLRADKAVEEIGFDVAELQPGVSKEFLDAVREKIDAKETQERKRNAALTDDEKVKVGVI